MRPRCASGPKISAPRRADQRRAGERAALEAGEVVDAEARQNERQHDADRGEVVAVGEHPHAGGEQGEPMEALEGLLIERGERLLGGHAQSLLVGHASRPQVAPDCDAAVATA
ncbi:MAG TPA: hypothetical protein VMB81_29505 [Candidatus Sulfotelmatobacter sp.]|nr:hypothetical protein [Candidatus Sulfotelmatobacter sp.]